MQTLSCRKDACVYFVKGSGRRIFAAADRIPVRVVPVVDKMIDIIQRCHIKACVKIRNELGVSQFTGQINAVLLFVSEADSEQSAVSGQNHSGGHGKSREALIDHIREQIGRAGIENPVSTIGKIKIKQALPLITFREFTIESVKPGLCSIQIARTA